MIIAKMVWVNGVLQICISSSTILTTDQSVFSCLTDLLENGLDKETSNPSWKLSLPHVLVGTISSFLFGYHLGFVLSQFLITMPSLGSLSLIENPVNMSMLIFCFLAFIQSS